MKFDRFDYFFLIAAYLSFMMSTGLWFFGYQAEGILFPLFMFGVVIMGVVALGLIEASRDDD
jgi:hypothetical protein